MSDSCPYCDVGFDVQGAKFCLTGVRLVSACRNCGMAKVDDDTSNAKTDPMPWPHRLLLAAGASLTIAAVVSQFAD
jgi:hypothetical protein